MSPLKQESLFGSDQQSVEGIFLCPVARAHAPWNVRSKLGEVVEG